MANSVASYDQLAHQVEALRKENFHLRRELEDNSNHLSKLENETSDMKDVLRQLQSKLEQEAGTLASSGRADVLDQLKELHMDLTNYYELKHQPHNLHVLSDTLSCLASQSDGGMETTLSSRLERTKGLLRPLALQSSNLSGDDTIMHPGHPHILEGAPPKKATIGGEYHITAQYLEELRKERTLLLSEIDKEERERCWYYTQLRGLSQRLAELPCIDTFSLQMDLIRQQLEFEAQQVRSVMVQRFGSSDEMVHRTQIRVARLEQLEKKLQEAQECQSPQDSGLLEPQIFNCEKTSNPDAENASFAPAVEASGDRGSKVEMVFWLLSMLANRDKEEMTQTLLAMSSSQDNCIAMRKSGCVPLLVQILHNIPAASEEALRGAGCNREVKSRASAALHNIIYSQPDEGQARREMRVLHLLEQISSHCDSGREWIEGHVGKLSPGGTKTTDIPEPLDPLICQAMCGIMKLSFEEEYRRAMNELGGLQVVAELMYLDQEMYGMQNDPINMALRRYAGMALTNLTFGDVFNKATLCSKKDCLQAIVAQLASDSEELHQVVSSILRNLSWRADINSKTVLRDIGSVSGLITCALQATKESTLKSLLSALWNLSAHSVENKVAVCSVDGALGFLVSTLTYRCQTNSLAIIESGGGILRNVSSLVATREDYRQILRDHNCLQTLLQHLRSHSLTIVSNACGTLWNLSAQNAKDQELLWDLGAVSMLRNLIHSKHKMIAMGSAAALRNLITNRPLKYKDTAVISPGSCMPSLYMRKQKALETELDAKNLTETFDSLEKLSPKHLSIKKPLRHIESLAKDYASDSGCFDDDEAPNVCGSLDTGSFSMLSMFLSNSNLLQNQPCKKDNEPERDVVLLQTMGNCPTSTDDVSAAADKLAKKITNTVAKIDKLVEDITMHTSSEDSFSLSSEDPFADWPYGSGELHEARAKSCSPFHFSDTSSFAHKDQLSRAHALLRLKTAHISLSTDSLNSGSTSDGYCGSKDQIQPSAKAVAMQSRPNKLNLKVAHQEYLNGDALVLQETNQTEVPKKDSINGEVILSEANSTETEKYQELQPQTPASVSTKLSSDVSMTSVKLSPSYTHVPLSQSVDKLSAAKTSISAQAPQAMKRQAWVPPGGSVLKCSPMSSAKSPILGPMETLQKYSVENTPICFSRCSSLSSLSSGEGALDGHSHSEYELESDLSLEIIEVDDSEVLNREEESETKDDLRCDEQPPVTESRTSRSDPIEIPCTLKHEKTFLRAGSPSILEDKSPSSSSENYLQETPLVMSRCSSVSSLGSFESPSIASSILSDQCSGIISGTLSPSDLPDSPGQTMPPSRSKTPCCVESSGPDPQTTVIAGQWESSLCKFMEIADFKERFNIPPDLDTMIYFTVEKPTENFSCASSLSALPLHEHYIQKDVELKLTPLQQQKDNDAEFPDDKDHPSVMDQGGRYSEGNSDEDIEILKECINSAMPSKFRKARPSMMSTLPTRVLSCQSRNPVHVPMYMMLPNNGKQMCTKVVLPQKDNQLDDSSFTDSAEGTPINLSSTTSLSDETLQYSVRDKGAKDWAVGNITKQELLNDEAKRIEDLRIFSHFHKPPKITSRHDMLAGTTGRSIKHVIPTQKVLMQSKEVTDRVVNQRNCDQSSFEQRQKLALTRKLQLPDRKQNTEGHQNQRAPQRHVAPESICHITPTEGTIYCFCDEERGKKQGNTKRTERPLNNDSNRDNVSQSMTNISRFDNSQLRHKVVNKVRQNLIKDDTPLCYSLSSSLSSLSDADLKDHKSKTLKVWTKNKHNQASNKVQQTKPMLNYERYGGHSSPSSVSMDSEDDLLQKCITSAMPKQKKKLSARKKKTEKNQKKNLQKVSEGWNTEQACDSDDMASDVDSDLNSVEWRAIQEGANSVVNRLQASKSEENSSEESESVLSFMSGSSFTPKEKKFSVDKKANKPLDFAPRKPVPNMPMVFRGRTVIYTPKKEIVLSQRPQPIKMSSKTDAPKNPNLAQHRSKSLHRLGKPQEIELSLPKRSSTPPPRIPKSSSSGSSQSSTPSRQSQRKLTSPSRSIKAIAQKSANPASISSERKGRSLVSSNQSLKSQAHKTQKSPVRISFMQNSTRSRTVSPLVNDQPTNKNRQHTQVPEKKNVPANRYNMVRMTSVQSNSSESDHNGLLRQLTFIKESKSLLKRNGSSPRSLATQQQGSSMRTCPGASAVFLCSSRCQELKAVVQAPRRMQGKCHEAQQEEKGKTVSLAKTTSSEHTLNARRSSRRTSSESPCRVPQRNISGRVSGDKQQDKDTFKRHSSSPSLNLLSRVTSRSSLRSSSSDSSGRTKSEDDTKKRQQRTGTHLKDKVTWRRIRDEDEPQTLKNALPPTALPLFVSGEQPKGNHPALPGKLPTLLLQSRKTSDATVQTEDFLTNKTLSSISTTADPALVLSEEAARLALLRKISNASGGTLQDGDFDCSIKSYSTASTANSHPVESHTGGVGCFRQSSPSRAVRVTPFNYIPSPMGGQDKHSQSLTINKNSNENTEA